MRSLRVAGKPILYFDLGSPYAYLALERAEALLGRMPTLEPVLLGAIFSWRGWGSWALGLERAQRMAEVQTRAHAYGLPPITWPAGWPGNGLAAMRAATWAKREGRVEAFARSVVRVQFIHGADITDGEVLAACAQDAVWIPIRCGRRSLRRRSRQPSGRRPSRRGMPG